MNYFFTKHNIFSFLTILALILNVAISGISNDSLISNIIKIISSSLLLILFFIHSRLSDIQLSSPLPAAPLKVDYRSQISVISNPVYRVRNLFSGISKRVLGRRLTRNSLFGFMQLSPLRHIGSAITIIILYLAITLTYSTNPGYGARKLLNIIISDIPNIVVLFYLITYRQKELYAKHLISIIAIGFILILIALLVFQPFDHSTIYQFSTRRWSHVFIGRMISFLTLINFMFLLNQKESKKVIIYSIVFTVGLYITYLTGLRSALIGLTLFTAIALIWSLYKKKILKSHLYSIILIMVIISLLVYITPQEFNTSGRISNLVKIEDLGFGEDAAILTRVESYKISWQMFTERPLFGYGFGSFNGYNNIQWTTIQKYPHNIILEILSELGIIGFVLFCFLVFYLIKKIISPPQWDQPIIPLGSSIPPVILSASSRAKSRDEGHHPSSIIHPSSLILSPHFLLLAFFFSLFLAMFSKDISTQSFLWLFLVALSGKGKGHSVK